MQQQIFGSLKTELFMEKIIRKLNVNVSAYTGNHFFLASPFCLSSFGWNFISKGTNGRQSQIIASFNLACRTFYTCPDTWTSTLPLRRRREASGGIVLHFINFRFRSNLTSLSVRASDSFLIMLLTNQRNLTLRVYSATSCFGGRLTSPDMLHMRMDVDDIIWGGGFNVRPNKNCFWKYPRTCGQSLSQQLRHRSWCSFK